MYSVSLQRIRLVALTLLAAGVLSVVPVLAHTKITEAVPAADSTVSAPTEVVIHFSGPLEPKFSSISVTDAVGHVINKTPAKCAADAKSMSVPLPTLSPGIYMVNWIGVSADTHRSQGSYKFTVK